MYKKFRIPIYFFLCRTAFIVLIVPVRAASCIFLMISSMHVYLFVCINVCMCRLQYLTASMQPPCMCLFSVRYMALSMIMYFIYIVFHVIFSSVACCVLYMFLLFCRYCNELDKYIDTVLVSQLNIHDVTT